MRGRQEAELPPVTDLLGRLQAYNVDGFMCKRCRAWTTLDAAKVDGWWILAADLYCPACAEGVRTAADERVEPLASGTPS